jgi:excisionase family DNA binding protein
MTAPESGTSYLSPPEGFTSWTVSVEEAAHLLGIGRTAAYSAISRRELPAIRIGRRLRIPVRGLLMLLNGEDYRSHPIGEAS